MDKSPAGSTATGNPFYAIYQFSIANPRSLSSKSSGVHWKIFLVDAAVLFLMGFPTRLDLSNLNTKRLKISMNFIASKNAMP